MTYKVLRGSDLAKSILLALGFEENSPGRQAVKVHSPDALFSKISITAGGPHEQRELTLDGDGTIIF